MNKNTLIIGASSNPERYSFKAAQLLQSHGYRVQAIGIKPGRIGDLDIKTEIQHLENIDTVTLYLNPERQADYYDYILRLKPRRVIFNPGTENSYFENLLEKNQIQAVRACTLVMIKTCQF